MISSSSMHMDVTLRSTGTRATDAGTVAPTVEARLVAADVVELAELLCIDIALAPFGIEELQLALHIEREMAQVGAYPVTDLLDNDEVRLVELGMSAMAYLQEQPDQYGWRSVAHAPGDPTPARYAHADVGSD